MLHMQDELHDRASLMGLSHGLVQTACDGDNSASHKLVRQSPSSRRCFEHADCRGAIVIKTRRLGEHVR